MKPRLSVWLRMSSVLVLGLAGCASGSKDHNDNHAATDDNTHEYTFTQADVDGFTSFHVPDTFVFEESKVGKKTVAEVVRYSARTPASDGGFFQEMIERVRNMKSADLLSKFKNSKDPKVAEQQALFLKGVRKNVTAAAQDDALANRLARTYSEAFTKDLREQNAELAARLDKFDGEVRSLDGQKLSREEFNSRLGKKVEELKKEIEGDSTKMKAFAASDGAMFTKFFATSVEKVAGHVETNAGYAAGNVTKASGRASGAAAPSGKMNFGTAKYSIPSNVPLSTQLSVPVDKSVALLKQRNGEMAKGFDAVTKEIATSVKPNQKMKQADAISFLNRVKTISKNDKNMAETNKVIDEAIAKVKSGSGPIDTQVRSVVSASNRDLSAVTGTELGKMTDQEIADGHYGMLRSGVENTFKAVDEKVVQDTIAQLEELKRRPGTSKAFSDEIEGVIVEMRDFCTKNSFVEGGKTVCPMYYQEGCAAFTEATAQNFRKAYAHVREYAASREKCWDTYVLGAVDFEIKELRRPLAEAGLAVEELGLNCGAFSKEIGNGAKNLNRQIASDGLSALPEPNCNPAKR